MFSCGPLSVLNAMKWCGLKCSYKKNYKEIFHYCRTDAEGTNFDNLGEALKHYLKDVAVVKEIEGKSAENLQEYLKNKKFSLVVMTYHKEENFYHVSFWYHATKYFFYVANFFENETYSIIKVNNKEQLEKIQLVYLIEKLQ